LYFRKYVPSAPCLEEATGGRTAPAVAESQPSQSHAPVQTRVNPRATAAVAGAAVARVTCGHGGSREFHNRSCRCVIIFGERRGKDMAVWEKDVIAKAFQQSPEPVLAWNAAKDKYDEQ